MEHLRTLVPPVSSSRSNGMYIKLCSGITSDYFPVKLTHALMKNFSNSLCREFQFIFSLRHDTNSISKVGLFQ